MQTILLSRVKPGSEFQISSSLVTPLELDAAGFIGDVDGQVIFATATKPLVMRERRHLSALLCRAGLVPMVHPFDD